MNSFTLTAVGNLARNPELVQKGDKSYAPRGVGAVSAGARLLCRRVKTSDPLWIPRYAGCVVQLWLRGTFFQRLFTPDVILVPVPGSSVSRGVPWAAWQLAI